MRTIALVVAVAALGLLSGCGLCFLPCAVCGAVPTVTARPLTLPAAEGALPVSTSMSASTAASKAAAATSPAMAH